MANHNWIIAAPAETTMLPSPKNTFGNSICIAMVDAGDPHPNTYRLALQNSRERHSLIAISTGGGMIEIVAVDGFQVSICGDCFETLLWVDGSCWKISKSTVPSRESFSYQTRLGKSARGLRSCSAQAARAFGKRSSIRRSKRWSPRRVASMGRRRNDSSKYCLK